MPIVRRVLLQIGFWVCCPFGYCGMCKLVGRERWGYRLCLGWVYCEFLSSPLFTTYHEVWAVNWENRCGVSAIVRVPYLFRLDSTKDFTRDWVNIALCSIVEPGLGILAASFAAFRPLFLTKRFQSLYSGFLSTTKSWTKGSGWTGFSQKSGTASTMEEGKLGGIHKATMVEIRRSSMQRNEESPVRKEAFETVELG